MTTHHFFSPHRDDGILIFGGHILNLLSNNESVVLHIIFGMDGYLRPQFIEELKTVGIRHPHINKLITFPKMHNSNYRERIGDLLTSKGSNSLELGIIIRHLEESIIAQKASYKLCEYDLPCAYPLRNYLKFNDPLREDDYIYMRDILTGKSSYEDNHFKKTKQLLFDTKPVSELHHLLNPTKLTSGDDVKLYFPAGIGGHPDHLILAKIGINISQQHPEKIVFGQDLPYSLVQEWFCESPLPFKKMEKCVVGIEQSLSGKLELLSLYKSQLSEEDLRLAEAYPKYIGHLISREYKLKGDFEKLIRKNIPVEIQYQFPYA